MHKSLPVCGITSSLKMADASKSSRNLVFLVYLNNLSIYYIQTPHPCQEKKYCCLEGGIKIFWVRERKLKGCAQTYELLKKFV